MFRHVLVRLHDSPETEFAVGAAVTFAKGYGSTLTGLYVREPYPVHIGPDVTGRALATLSAANVPVITEETEVYAATEGERQARALNTFEAMASAAKVPFRRMIRDGDASDELLVSSVTADLVAMPRGEYDLGAVGSETASIVKRVPHPFLIASETIDAIEHIAVAFDGSAGAVRALAAAADIALNFRQGPPEIVLVEVLPTPDESESHLADAEDYLRLYELPHRCVTLMGAAADQIAAFARDEGVDLLCMGAYGHSALRELVLGSTTHGVIRQRRKPILLCH